MEIAFVPFDESFLHASYVWLQDEALRALIDSPPVTKASQQLWFQGLSNRNDYHIWGVTADSIPVGVCGIKHVNNGKGEYWGYIGEKDHWGKGIGTKMLYFIAAFAKSIGLAVIQLSVLKHNQRAFYLYLRNGFIVIEDSGDKIFMEKNLADD